MKSKFLSFVALFLLGAVTVFAGEKTEKFKVYGNCGMCEKTIEKAAKSVEGVQLADWNKETKMMEVTYDDAKTDIHKVHTAIAKAGYDTEMHKAPEAAYKELPSCCKYDRPAEKAEKRENLKDEQAN